MHAFERAFLFVPLGGDVTAYLFGGAKFIVKHCTIVNWRHLQLGIAAPLLKPVAFPIWVCLYIK